MSVLVTGGNGFVGKALVQSLLARGHDVVCAGRQPAGNQSSVRFIPIGNIDAHTDWEFPLKNVDLVVHLAGRAHVLRESAHDPLQEFRAVNVDGTLNLARQAITAGVRRFIFISSIGVHGGKSLRPFTETDVPAPIEPYAISKLESELALADLLGSSNMEFVIIRPPLVYGPNAPGNFGRLVKVLKSGIILPLGAINNRRTLIGLENLVDLICCCALHPKAANEVFLAGDAQDLSTTELLIQLSAMLDRPARLIAVPVWLLEAIGALVGHRATVRKLCGDLQIDISKARRILGWSPPLSVSDALRKMAEAMQ